MRKWRNIFWVAILAMLGFALLYRSDVFSVRYSDEYPNSSTKIAEAIKSDGARTYDIAKLLDMSNVTAICFTLGGGDPRKLAVTSLNLSERQLEVDKQPYFVQEKSVSILVVGHSGFKIESFGYNQIDFEGEMRDRCVTNTTSARLIVTSGQSKRTFAKLLGRFEIH